MTEAQKILSMIESVSPDDAAALDEIDVSVFKYLGLYIPGYDIDISPVSETMVMYGGGDQVKIPQYTRSRDVLKAIRPDGCFSYVWRNSNKKFLGEIVGINKKFDDNTLTYTLPKEELAELHILIQAIEFDRSQK